MGGAAPMDYAWFVEEYQKDSDLIGVTFVRGLSAPLPVTPPEKWALPPTRETEERC
ncbi:hypothetical protein [Nonomuraea insulae]|uniref:Uncharacterized protein n=1 Tax=Nonomuraea insulae TaxID=1616787 RepID=A0ABW1D2Y9_9ACTN